MVISSDALGGGINPFRLYCKLTLSASNFGYVVPETGVRS